jgi:processive 1,2-diacylglycerol beta-glucosyltransferase
MIHLHNKRNNRHLGIITETQLQFLIDQLEEEWLEDQDYAITPLLIDMFKSQGADLELIATLTGALGGREEVVVVWSRRGEG